MSALTEAASVLLTRAPGSREVYLVGRSPTLRFMGGMVAFPGGKVHASDADLARPTIGLTVRHVCAVRELFEETGVLLARQADGSHPARRDVFDDWRRALLDEKRSFAELLTEAYLHLDPADLVPVGSLVTPAFSLMRFDTGFFVGILPHGQKAEVWPGELTHGQWSSASAALGLWQQGLLPLTPPSVTILQAIEDRPIEELPDRLKPQLDRFDRGDMPPIWFSPGVLMMPLESQGLPPTTHTNALLVGTGPHYLIDPGPIDPVEQEKLFAILANQHVDAIILSHHHPDHVAAAEVCAKRFQAPILAHRLTAELLDGHVRVDRFIAEGEVFDLGEAPHGRGRWTMIAVHTPGHAPGHLAFYIPDYQLLLAGDMVSTQSSMIISPDDGDLAQYVQSLQRLKRFPLRLLMPAHGGPTTRPTAILDEAISHRALREKQLLEAMGNQPCNIDELALTMYRGFPPETIRLARLQIHAGLIKLQREALVVALEDGRWQRIPG